MPSISPPEYYLEVPEEDCERYLVRVGEGVQIARYDWKGSEARRINNRLYVLNTPENRKKHVLAYATCWQRTLFGGGVQGG